MRLAVVTPIPTPYRDPFWEVVASEEGVELMVIYCSAGKSDRPWKSDTTFSYRREFPEGRNLLSRFGWGASAYWNPGATRLLADFKPDRVLIGGYNHPTMLSAIRFCNRRKVPWYLMTESWAKRPGVLGRVKDQWLRTMLKTAAGACPTGLLASRRLEELGIESQRQCRLPNVPDIHRLSQVKVTNRERSAEIKGELGIDPEDRVILFAARMIEKKRPILVLEAFKLFDDPNCKLVMLGDGPLMAQVREFVHQADLESRVILPGFVDTETVYRWMSIADVFVQPSRETWGVAPIEALACGANVILSQEVGSAADLVTLTNRISVIEDVTVDCLANAIQQCLRERDTIVQSEPPILGDLHHSALAIRLTTFLERKAKIN